MNYYTATILQSLVFRKQNNCIAAFPRIILLFQFHFYDFQKGCFSFLYTSKNFRPETDLFCQLIKVPFQFSIKTNNPYTDYGYSVLAESALLSKRAMLIP